MSNQGLCADMQRKKLPITTIALVVSAFLLGMFISSGSDMLGAATQSSDPASRAPDVALPDTQGQTRSLKEWPDKVIVVNFWATWCPPCIHEIPMFVELQTIYAQRGVQFFGVAIDELESVREFAEAQSLNYPTVHGQQAAIDLMRDYGNTTGGLPYTVLVGPDRQVVRRKAGAVTRDEMTSMLDAVLAQP